MDSPEYLYYEDLHMGYLWSQLMLTLHYSPRAANSGIRTSGGSKRVRAQNIR